MPLHFSLLVYLNAEWNIYSFIRPQLVSLLLSCLHSGVHLFLHFPFQQLCLPVCVHTLLSPSLNFLHNQPPSINQLSPISCPIPLLYPTYTSWGPTISSIYCYVIYLLAALFPLPHHPILFRAVNIFILTITCFRKNAYLGSWFHFCKNFEDFHFSKWVQTPPQGLENPKPYQHCLAFSLPIFLLSVTTYTSVHSSHA